MDDRRRIVPAGQVNAVVQIAFHPRQRRLEKSFASEPIGGEALLFLAGKDDAHFLRVRPEDANRQVIAEAMRTKDTERIRMSAGEKNVELVSRQAGYFE
jgi:hypothetical protein